VQDQIGAPTWSREIARGTTEILTQLLRRQGRAGGFGPATGVYHMTADGETSRYDFAKAILEEASKCEHSAPWFQAATNNLPLLTSRVIPITTEEFPAPARPTRLLSAFQCPFARAFQHPTAATGRSQLRAALPTGSSFRPIAMGVPEPPIPSRKDDRALTKCRCRSPKCHPTTKREDSGLIYAERSVIDTGCVEALETETTDWLAWTGFGLKRRNP